MALGDPTEPGSSSESQALPLALPLTCDCHFTHTWSRPSFSHPTASFGGGYVNPQFLMCILLFTLDSHCSRTWAFKISLSLYATMYHLSANFRENEHLSALSAFLAARVHVYMCPGRAARQKLTLLKREAMSYLRKVSLNL